MPLRLNVGVSRKLGLPDYSSAGATCNIELELDQGLLDRDPEGFRARVRDAYVAARQAVHDELDRLQDRTTASSAAPATNGHGRGEGPGEPGTAAAHEPHGNGRAHADRVQPAGGRPARPRKPATPKQVGAILALTRQNGADLEGLLRDDYGVGRAEDLSLAQASQLIDTLKAAAAL